jgi:hypothetical protein
MRPLVKSLSMTPGAMALARMPSGASSRASALASPKMPDLALAGDRGYQHDRPFAAGPQMGDRRLGHLKVAAQVDVDHLVVFLAGDVEDAGAVDHAGVADQHVDPAEGLGRPGDRGLAGGALAHVAGQAEVFGPELRRGGRRIGPCQIQDRDPRALLGEEARRRPSDAVGRGGAGDDRRAVLQELHLSASVVALSLGSVSMAAAALPRCVSMHAVLRARASDTHEPAEPARAARDRCG